MHMLMLASTNFYQGLVMPKIQMNQHYWQQLKANNIQTRTNNHCQSLENKEKRILVACNTEQVEIVCEISEGPNRKGTEDGLQVPGTRQACHFQLA